MNLLRGAAVRHLRSLLVRPYSIAVDVSGASALANAVGSVRVARDAAGGEASDVTWHMSLREAQKSRTRARVEGQLHAFLRTRAGPANESWSQGPPREAYWMLRACGSDMILETTETRMDLVQKMWAEFQTRGPLPVGMYNTLLQVYLQNSHRFDVADFLEGMEKDGVLPNQGTLVGILCCCCDDGDIDGATKILDQMKSLDMDISETIYASLITGNCRRGDMTSAEGMLTMMEENGMSPTATSYSALLCGHADRGNMDRIEKLLEEMRARRVFPSVAVYTAVLDHLSASGHSDLLTRALDLVHNKQLIYNDLYELACKCTMRRDNKGTMVMLRCLATLVPKTTNLQLGAVLVRTMITQGRSLPEVMVMVAELQSLGFGHHVYEEILYSLHIRQDNREQAMIEALTVLQDMHRHGVVVKEHYFYPLLVHYAEKGDLEGAVRCVTVMKDFGMKLRRMGFQYLLQASGKVGVAGDVIEGGVTNDVIEGGVASDVIEGSVAGDVNHLLDHIEGTPLSLSLVNEFSVYLLDRGEFSRVPDLLTSVDSGSLVIGQLLKAIKTGLKESLEVDVSGLVDVYVALHSLIDGSKLTRSVAITTALLIQKSRDLAKQFIEELDKKGIEPGEDAYHLLLQSYATANTAKEFHTLVRSLQSRGVVLRPSVHKQILQLAADTGDPVRAGQAVSAIRRSGQRLSATAFSRYIVANAKSRRIGTALELYEKMRGHDLRPSYEAVSQLMLELLRWGDIHGAENMRRDLEEMGYVAGLGLRNAFIGAYARRDMTKALEEFESLKASETTPTTFTYNEIMVGYSLHGDTESIRKLFDELQKEGLSLDRSLISRLFDAYVTKGDIDGALGLLGEFPSLQPHTTSLTTAMQLAVDRGSEEEMERVREAVTAVSGAGTADNVLLFAYVRAGHMTRAEQILQNEGFSLNSRDFVTFVIDMNKKRRREEVYAVLELLKSKGHHLGDKTSVAWLRAYDMLGDVGCALALRDELLAAGQTLSDEFNSRLAGMLRSHGHTTTQDAD